MIVTDAARQIATGLTFGLGGVALFLYLLGATLLEGFLFKVNALEPWIYAAVAVLLTGVSAVSCLVPGRKATGVDPIVALRAQ